MSKLLAAFDFDWTIINSNSDVVIRKMMPASQIPEDVKHIYKKHGWIYYMQQIFDLLYENDITEDAILKKCRHFEPTPGMVNLILELKKTFTADIIIISDSNSIFIQEWLKSKGLDKFIDAIFTNPAKFNDEGKLKIDMYHKQDWCELSANNLCKGHVLKEFIKDKNYNMIAYTGDGKNDLCPSLTLNSKDFIFPRSGYPLMTAINECNIKKTYFINAPVYPWKSGNDILEVLKENILNK